MLQFMGSQRVRHDLMAEEQQHPTRKTECLHLQYHPPVPWDKLRFESFCVHWFLFFIAGGKEGILKFRTFFFSFL